MLLKVKPKTQCIRDVNERRLSNTKKQATRNASTHIYVTAINKLHVMPVHTYVTAINKTHLMPVHTYT